MTGERHNALATLEHGGVVSRGGRFFCWHRYTRDERLGVHLYRECGKCGKRSVQCVVVGVMSPVDLDWIGIP